MIDPNSNVYTALNTSTGELLAVKIVRYVFWLLFIKIDIKEGEDFELIKEKVDIIKNLDHPNIH